LNTSLHRALQGWARRRVRQRFYQLDLRGGNNFKLPANRTFAVYVDVINVTNRSNFDHRAGIGV
jgi:hypothetical protein